ncbi:hypothetical protein HGRIS_004883 [Hohenbuehelia grisea]|uniref:Uncharacterized protein n=1 Tax=Hohenbuehelia grisea TaxID=104357 RepID=A0ABR3JE42_9AGAR
MLPASCNYAAAYLQPTQFNYVGIHNSSVPQSPATTPDSDAMVTESVQQQRATARSALALRERSLPLALPASRREDEVKARAHGHEPFDCRLKPDAAALKRAVSVRCLDEGVDLGADYAWSDIQALEHSYGYETAGGGGIGIELDWDLESGA